MFPTAFFHWSASCDLAIPSCSAVLAMFFICAAFLLIPRTILLIGAGALFGLKSLLVILPSATLGSLLSFLLARHLFRAWFQRLIETRPRLKAISEAVDAEGWRVVAIMRLGVPVPSALQNYMFGLTQVRPLSFAMATLVFSIPQTFLFVFVGLTGRATLIGDDGLIDRLSLALGCILTLALILLIGRRARYELRLATGQRV